MITLADKAQCSGCTACANVCAHSAITMEKDTMGFFYPKVNQSKCTNCGLCEKICPFHENYNIDENFNEPKAYGFRLTDENILMNSQSGAAFIALSDLILNKGGVIYGASFSDSFRVIHQRATTKAERDTFRGSKYVQSELGTIFKQVLKDLKAKLCVCFCGTPCQIAGLKAYIPKTYKSQLYLVDLVCHGVPAPNIWRDYLLYLKAKHHKSIKAANFRNKRKYGWSISKETYLLDGDEEVTETGFLTLFYSKLVLRESCFKCKFSNTRRTGDITIGDFWGCEKVNTNLANDQKGVSLILCNTPKGINLLEEVRNNSANMMFEISLDKALQPNLIAPTSRPIKRTPFEADYTMYGFIYVFKKYGPIGWRQKTKYIINKLFHAPQTLAFKIKHLTITK